MKLTSYLSMLAMVVMLSGCNLINPDTDRVKALTDMTAPYAAGAITLDIQANPDLNSVNDTANSCTVLLIQMQDPAVLEKIISNPVALRSLFSSGAPGDDILKIDRYVMMPGQSTSLHIDRAFNAHQVAFVAGYYPSPGKQHVLSIPIPVQTWNTSWFLNNWQAGLGTLKINVLLGKEGILRAEYPAVTAEGKNSDSANDDK